MNNKILITFLSALIIYALTATFTLSANKKESTSHQTVLISDEIKNEMLYASFKADDIVLPSRESFFNAFKGYTRLNNENILENQLLTVIDFTLSSNEKRMWVIDMQSNTVLYNTHVAHGRNTGLEYASKFSNIPESFKSSVGFYATGETYHGKNGFSLRLDGLENGINDKARARAIVIHGADYATERFIAQNGRLGRSLGCPALPSEISKEVIDAIKNKSLLYIHSSDVNYPKISEVFRG